MLYSFLLTAVQRKPLALTGIHSLPKSTAHMEIRKVGPLTDSNSGHALQCVHTFQPSNRIALSKAVEAAAVRYGLGLATIVTISILGLLIPTLLFLIISLTW